MTKVSFSLWAFVCLLGVGALAPRGASAASATITAAQAGVTFHGPNSSYPPQAIMDCVLNIMPYSEWQFGSSRFTYLVAYAGFCKKNGSVDSQACFNELRDTAKLGKQVALDLCAVNQSPEAKDCVKSFAARGTLFSTDLGKASVKLCGLAPDAASVKCFQDAAVAQIKPESAAKLCSQGSPVEAGSCARTLSEANIGPGLIYVLCSQNPSKKAQACLLNIKLHDIQVADEKTAALSCALDPGAAENLMTLEVLNRTPGGCGTAQRPASGTVDTEVATGGSGGPAGGAHH